jgi:LuxR family maltose regulon positive regulatory protein
LDTLSSYSLILPTKLYRPPVTEDFIPRPQLLQLLDGVHLRPLTVVSAPAGYGKTTLLSAWLEDCGHQSTWLSLDEDDNNLATFLSYLVAGIQRKFPAVGEKILPLLDTVILPPLATIISYLIFELESVETDFVFVLDDFQFISNPDIHTVIMELLRHPHRAFHLVISTRRDPSLPLAAYRARNLVTEIRTPDLRFSSQETRLFIERVLGSPIDEKTISALDEQTEGWPAGLRLASLSFKYGLNINLVRIGVLGNNRFIMEYLMSEVIAHLSPAIQDFIIKTSFLDQLCQPLCDAIIVPDNPQGNSQIYLEWLEDANVFIVPLDAKRFWYRFHHLFQDFLRDMMLHRFTPVQIAAFHCRAAAWFAQNGMIEEAIDHSLAGGDIRTAIQLVDTHRHKLMNQERWQRLALLLKKFPKSVIDSEPELLVLSAWISQSHLNLYKTWHTVERLSALMSNTSLEPEQECNLQISIDVFSSTKYNWAADFPRAIFHAQRALANAPRTWYIMRSFAWLHLITATFFSSGIQPTQVLLEEGKEDDFFNPYEDHVRVRASECFVSFIAGDLPNVIRTAGYLLRIAQVNRQAESISYMHFFLGAAYYFQNNLVEAEEHFRRVVEERYVSHPSGFVQSAIGLALVYKVQGLEEKAGQTIDLAVEFCQERDYAPQLSMMKAFQAERNLSQGNLAKSAEWAKQVDSSAPLKIMPYFFDEQITPAKVLLAQNTPGSLKQAAEMLSRLQEFVTATHNTHHLIEVLALQALLYVALDNEQAAFNALTQSLLLAQPGGFIRLYVDLGPRMADLLFRLRKHHDIPGYIGEILDAFPTSRPTVPSGGYDRIIQPLTDRELKILELLAQRLSNKEIASELVISPITVKRHTINIYQKLNVKSRREAVDMAVIQGILRQS